MIAQGVSKKGEGNQTTSYTVLIRRMQNLVFRLIALLLDRAHGVMPEEIHGVLDPYLERLDEQYPS